MIQAKIQIKRKERKRTKQKLIDVKSLYENAHSNKKTRNLAFCNRS